jgi:hypothetical protein
MSKKQATITVAALAIATVLSSFMVGYVGLPLWVAFIAGAGTGLGALSVLAMARREK